MNLIIWKETYSVGIERIDNEHKELIRIFNDLLNAMAIGQGYTVVEEIFQGLTAYSKNHFASEKKIMESYNYPEKEEHLKEHDTFTKQVIEYKNDYESGNRKVSVQLMNFIREWLVTHWNGTDKKLGLFLQAKGFE